jgi:hypothetical protein
LAVGALAAPGAAQAAAPSATTGQATATAGTTATISGTVLTGGEKTTYHFEWGTTTAYGTSSPNGTANGNAPRTVAADLSGLQPNTTYHFRLVASNASGTDFGADAKFTTTSGPPVQPDKVTIGATPRTVTFGKPVTISGSVPGEPAVAVQLEQTPYPFTTPFTNIIDGLTDASANYAFRPLPDVNTRYRVIAKASPTVESGELTVLVRPRVTLRLSDRTPSRGRRVRFRGSVLPAHDGSNVRIQRRTRSGWRTVKEVALVGATPLDGDTRSRYSTRIRVRRDGAYRTVVPAHPDHARGKTRRKSVDVHG